MQIESICVTNHICGGFEQVSMGRNAETKSLPFLSVVQSTHGSYRIALDDGPELETGEMGVFVAPRARMQHLLHIPDERDGTMSAQWISWMWKSTAVTGWTICFCSQLFYRKSTIRTYTFCSDASLQPNGLRIGCRTFTACCVSYWK